MNFKVKPKPAAGVESQDKCPVCRYAWQDFADILGTGVLLGCYKCGCVFMSRDCCMEDISGKRDYLRDIEIKKAVDAVSDAEKGWSDLPTALCGKECKNNAGVRLHEMRCKKCAEIRDGKD